MLLGLEDERIKFILVGWWGGGKQQLYFKKFHMNGCTLTGLNCQSVYNQKDLYSVPLLHKDYHVVISPPGG